MSKYGVFVTKTDSKGYISSQLKMEGEVAPLKMQNDGAKVIKLKVESLRKFSWGVHFS